MRAAVAAAGAPAGRRLHDLRHHGATLTARSGATTKELMARIGHASPRAALIYQHATAERDHAIAAYLDEVAAAVERPARAPVVDLRPTVRPTARVQDAWRNGVGDPASPAERHSDLPF